MHFFTITFLVLNLLHPSFEAKKTGKTVQKKAARNQIESCIKAELQKGIKEFSIPSLEPLEVSKTKIALDDNKLSCFGNTTGSVEIQDLKCDDLTRWEILDTNSKITSFFPLTFLNSLIIKFKTLKCKTKYSDLDLILKDKKFSGRGEIGFDANNFALDLSFDYEIFSKKVTKLEVMPTLQKLIYFNITGLNFDSKLSEKISKMFLLYAPSILEENSNDMNACLQEFTSSQVYEEESLSTYLVNKCIA